MGMYTSVRMVLTVKEKFRKNFDQIVYLGRWDLSTDPILKEFGDTHYRAEFIGKGMLSYAPDSWEIQTIPGDYSSYVATDGFDTQWNEENGVWVAQFSLKNYEEEIEDFMDIIPYFCDEAHLEYFYEEWRDSVLYELDSRTHKMVCTNRHYRQYRDY